MPWRKATPRRRSQSTPLAARVQSRLRSRLDLAKAVWSSRTPLGRIRRLAAVTNSISIWPSTGEVILKDVGVLIQTLNMMATDMGSADVRPGANIDLFAKMTGIEFQGPVGQHPRGARRGPLHAV